MHLKTLTQSDKKLIKSIFRDSFKSASSKINIQEANLKELYFRSDELKICGYWGYDQQGRHPVLNGGCKHPFILSYVHLFSRNFTKWKFNGVDVGIDNFGNVMDDYFGREYFLEPKLNFEYESVEKIHTHLSQQVKVRCPNCNKSRNVLIARGSRVGIIGLPKLDDLPNRLFIHHKKLDGDIFS